MVIFMMKQYSNRLYDIEHHILDTIKARSHSLIKQYPMHEYLRLLDNQPNVFDYHDITNEVKKYCREITQHADENTLCLYHKVLLIRSIQNSRKKLFFLELPNKIKSLYLKQFEKIIEQMSTNEESFYRYSNGRFCKDLALCRLRMIPAGAVLLEQGRLSRRFLLKKGLSQFAKGMTFIIRELKACGPFYQGHFDTRPGSICLSEFNPEGWKQTFRRVAELLKMKPHIKGFFGNGWFHDPKLEIISPKLKFINEMMVYQNNGGKLFYNGIDQRSIEDATLKSPTRRKLYEEGLYMPANYLFIWPRHKLISWADIVSESSCVLYGIFMKYN